MSRASGHERPLRDSVVRGSTYNGRTGFIRLIEQDLETVYRQITGEKCEAVGERSQLIAKRQVWISSSS